MRNRNKCRWFGFIHQMSDDINKFNKSAINEMETRTRSHSKMPSSQNNMLWFDSKIKMNIWAGRNTKKYHLYKQKVAAETKHNSQELSSHHDESWREKKETVWKQTEPLEWSIVIGNSLLLGVFHVDCDVTLTIIYCLGICLLTVRDAEKEAAWTPSQV